MTMMMTRTMTVMMKMTQKMTRIKDRNHMFSVLAVSLIIKLPIIQLCATTVNL